MNEEKLKSNIKYLVNKYLEDRTDLCALIEQDSDSVKYVLAEISKKKVCDYDEMDINLIRDIAFYYL